MSAAPAGGSEAGSPDRWRLDSRTHSPCPSEHDLHRSYDALGSAWESTLRSPAAHWADEHDGAGDGPAASAPEGAARGADAARPRPGADGVSAPGAARDAAPAAGAPGADGAGWAPAAAASRHGRKRLGREAAGAEGGRQAAAAAAASADGGGTGPGAGRAAAGAGDAAASPPPPGADAPPASASPRGEAARGAEASAEAAPLDTQELRDCLAQYLDGGGWDAARAVARRLGIPTQGRLRAVRRELLAELDALSDAAFRRVVARVATAEAARLGLAA